MTKKEARNLLNNSRPKGNNAYSIMLNEALDMAIQALEKKSVLDKIKKDITNTLYVDSLIFGELIDFKNGKISADDVIEEFNKISREEVINIIDKYLAENSEQQPKKGHCKDCKWWKDSDGEYRRGVGAESQCPINHKEVYEGNGHCFMYAPQENEAEEFDNLEEMLEKLWNEVEE